jgi:hypothetical protein
MAALRTGVEVPPTPCTPLEEPRLFHHKMAFRPVVHLTPLSGMADEFRMIWITNAFTKLPRGVTVLINTASPL